MMYLILCLLFGPAIQLSSSELIYSQLQDDLLSHELPYTASISPDFAHFSLVQPSYLHSRTKRQISTTKLDQDTNEHINHLTVKYSINNTLYTLDLILNRELLPASYFEKHQKDGAHVIRNRTNTKDIELCHYKGVLRDVPGSWAAISTCDNILRGVVYDGTELNYIEPLYDETVNSINSNHTNLSQHIVYKQSDFLSHDKHQCGYKSLHNITRTKRDTVSKHDEIRGPYNANIKSRYLELVIVVDNRLYNLFNKNSKLVHRHCKDISNVINALYEKLNIFIALVGVVVWTEYDEITLNVNGDITLTNFLSYRKDRLVLSHPNDNAQLLTGMTFSDGVVGKALKGPICTYEFSGGVNVDHKNVVGLVATTVAHEMGHNLGMEHDTTECTCPSDRCIMAPSSSSVSPTEWSSCSLEYLALSFDHGMDYCMRNKPKALFDSPVCGNGFVEDGEECDCGLEDSCKNACCNATTCMLKVNATCATGSCCNLETCQPHTAGRQCRAADRECDLPEFCTGDSEFCPSDVFKMDGETCKGGEAFCYEGSCRTHSDQCLLLWGPSASSSDKRCFDLNTSGNRRGNCGYYKPNMTYAKCEEEDVLCGMLHCQHLSEKLEYGIETVAILSHSFLNPGGFIIPCRSAIVDLGLNQVDPGLSPDGARCGDGKLCVNRKCMSVAALRASMPVADCPFNCHDQGVCNSRGHCHCHPGFAPPYCEYPGVGGSVDSGPASDPNESRLLITLFYVILVAVLPLSALILFLKYYNNHPKSFWWKRPFDTSKCNSNALTGHKVAKSTQNHSNSTSGGRGQRLLSSGEGQNYNLLAAKTHKSSDMSVKLPTRAAPVKPTPPKVPSDAQITPIRAAPKIPATSVRLSADFANFSATLPPELPPANKGPNTSPYARPLISSPVLSDTTSQTVRELIDAKNAESTRQTTRPASIAKSSTLPPVATESNALPGSTLHPVSNESNARKGSTLNRITSFMSRNSTRRNSKVLTPPNTQGSARSLEISEPIPLNNLRDNEDKVDMVKRTQSMRETDVNFKRPNLPAFGSMRAKRPTSLAGSQRPSQPPPPAPSGIQSLPGYQNPAGQTKTPSMIQSLPGYQNPSAGQGKTPGTPVQGPGQGLLSPAQGLLGYQNPVAPAAKPKTYDDCLNLLSESMAALANVDHNPNDNIYAVIEESPATSDLGLLGEIVSEIQARNTESIYSSQSLMDTNKLYMNTRDLENVSPDPTIKSTTSSGYLSPIGITDTNNVSRSSINKDTSSVNNTSNNNRSINKDTSHLNNRSIKDTPPSSINRTESISRPPESIQIDPSSYRLTHGSSSSVPSSVPSSSFSKPVNSSVNTFSSKPSVNVNSSVNNFSSKPSVNTSFSPSVNSPSNPANSFSSKPSVHSSANSSLSSPNVSSLHKPTSARPTSLVGLKVSSNAPTVPTSSQSGTKSKPSIKSSLADATKSMTKTSDIKSPTAKTESVTQPATKDSIIPKSGVNSAPKSAAKVNEVPKTGAATSYKPFSASRGPLSGNTVSSYTAKPVKPTVPQRPTSVVPGLKRPDLISSCSTGGNVATSPDVVNKPRSSVASLQQKFENL